MFLICIQLSSLPKGLLRIGSRSHFIMILKARRLYYCWQFLKFELNSPAYPKVLFKEPILWYFLKARQRHYCEHFLKICIKRSSLPQSLFRIGSSSGLSLMIIFWKLDNFYTVNIFQKNAINGLAYPKLISGLAPGANLMMIFKTRQLYYCWQFLNSKQTL